MRRMMAELNLGAKGPDAIEIVTADAESAAVTGRLRTILALG